MFDIQINQQKKARVQLMLAEMQSARSRREKMGVPVSGGQSLPEIEIALVRAIEDETAAEIERTQPEMFFSRRAIEVQRQNRAYYFGELVNEIDRANGY